MVNDLVEFWQLTEIIYETIEKNIPQKTTQSLTGESEIKVEKNKFFAE